MTQPAITTDAEAIAWLAGLETECLDCRQGSSIARRWDCPNCNATGKVRRFPGLMRECPVRLRSGFGDWGDGGIHRGDCAVCHGFGRIPIPIPDAVYWLMGQPGCQRLERMWVNGRYVWMVDWKDCFKSAPTIPQALAKAIAASLEE